VNHDAVAQHALPAGLPQAMTRTSALALSGPVALVGNRHTTHSASDNRAGLQRTAIARKTTIHRIGR